MLGEIIWSGRATREKIEILEYWKKRNRSTRYSIKLDGIIEETLELLISNPQLGKATDEPSVRIIIAVDYSIYYRVGSNTIDILSIWDNRRDPDKFKL